jgi:hypothetical protein
MQTASAKNKAPQEAGAHVHGGTLVPGSRARDLLGFQWVSRGGNVSVWFESQEFVSSISDDRGEELTYSEIPISEILKRTSAVEEWSRFSASVVSCLCAPVNSLK